jgi:hypothetical protein
MTWLNELFPVNKPIIAMCHLKALPGDPGYDAHKGIEWVVEMARADLRALQAGGVDGILFSNEASLPYLTTVEPITTACMARVIAELRGDLRVPFGVNVLWDPTASIDLAVATGGQFVREIFTGVYASDYGLWNTNCGAVIRHRHQVDGDHVRLFFNIVPESAVYLAERHIADIARSTVFVSGPDALCVSGLTAGAETPFETLKLVKDAVPDTVVFANTGVRATNVAQMLTIADGAIVGTTFKHDGYIWNAVDVERVRAFMDAAQAARH